MSWSEDHLPCKATAIHGRCLYRNTSHCTAPKNMPLERLRHNRHYRRCPPTNSTTTTTTTTTTTAAIPGRCRGKQITHLRKPKTVTKGWRRHHQYHRATDSYRPLPPPPTTVTVSSHHCITLHMSRMENLRPDQPKANHYQHYHHHRYHNHYLQSPPRPLHDHTWHMSWSEDLTPSRAETRLPSACFRVASAASDSKVLRVDSQTSTMIDEACFGHEGGSWR